MPFNPSSFLLSANQIFSSATHEADYRAVINRAYYSVFGFSRLRIQALFYETDISVHKKVISYLKESSTVKEKIIGSKLEYLFSERKKADYDYRIEILDWHCKNVLIDAQKILTLYEEIDQENKLVNDEL